MTNQKVQGQRNSNTNLGKQAIRKLVHKLKSEILKRLLKARIVFIKLKETLILTKKKKKFQRKI